MFSLLSRPLLFLGYLFAQKEDMSFLALARLSFLAFHDVSCCKYILIINDNRYFQCIERENYFDIVNEYRMWFGLINLFTHYSKLLQDLFLFCNIINSSSNKTKRSILQRTITHNLELICGNCKP